MEICRRRRRGTDGRVVRSIDLTEQSAPGERRKVRDKRKDRTDGRIVWARGFVVGPRLTTRRRRYGYTAAEPPRTAGRLRAPINRPPYQRDHGAPLSLSRAAARGGVQLYSSPNRRRRSYCVASVIVYIYIYTTVDATVSCTVAAPDARATMWTGGAATTTTLNRRNGTVGTARWTRWRCYRRSAQPFFFFFFAISNTCGKKKNDLPGYNACTYYAARSRFFFSNDV